MVYWHREKILPVSATDRRLETGEKHRKRGF